MRVKGTLKVERAATLKATGIRVIGNVQAEEHRSVAISRSSRIGGSVQIKVGSGFSLAGSTIGGDVQLFNNSGTSSVSSNRIDGNLQCKENRPAPTGANNVVGGNQEDQCARL